MRVLRNEHGAQLGYLQIVVQCADQKSDLHSPLTSESNIVEMDGSLDDLKLATDVELLYAGAEVSNGGMCWVVSTKHLDGLLDLIRLVNILHYVGVNSCSELK